MHSIALHCVNAGKSPASMDFAYPRFDPRLNACSRSPLLESVVAKSEDVAYTCENAQHFFLHHVRYRWEEFHKKLSIVGKNGANIHKARSSYARIWMWDDTVLTTVLETEDIPRLIHTGNYPRALHILHLAPFLCRGSGKGRDEEAPPRRRGRCSPCVADLFATLHLCLDSTQLRIHCASSRILICLVQGSGGSRWQAHGEFVPLRSLLGSAV